MTQDETGRKFVEYLRRFKEDRGAMSNLRRALNPGTRHYAWPLLGKWGGIDKPEFETVAGLFALHPLESAQGNLGTACRKLDEGSGSFDARFRRLLACDSKDEICERLRAVITMAARNGVGINYIQLFQDIRYWSDQQKTKWASEYWAVETSHESNPSAPEVTA